MKIDFSNFGIIKTIGIRDFFTLAILPEKQMWIHSCNSCQYIPYLQSFPKLITLPYMQDLSLEGQIYPSYMNRTPHNQT